MRLRALKIRKSHLFSGFYTTCMLTVAVWRALCMLMWTVCVCVCACLVCAIVVRFCWRDWHLNCQHVWARTEVFCLYQLMHWQSIWSVNWNLSSPPSSSPLSLPKCKHTADCYCTSLFITCVKRHLMTHLCSLKWSSLDAVCPPCATQ